MNSYFGFRLFSRVDLRCHRFFRPALLAVCTFGAALLSSRAQTITSAVPGYFSFQGKVVNASGTPLGASPSPVNRIVTFRIWSHATNAAAGDLVYSEQQTVTITDGEFSVLLGQGTAVTGTALGYSESAKGPPTVTIASLSVFGGATRFLGVTVDDGTGAADPEISPRQQMVTSAYAFRAKYAESIGSNGGSSLTVTDSGNVGIGTTTAGFPLTFAQSAGDKISLYGQSGAHYGFGIGNSQLQIHSDTVNSDITFGYGTSASLTETMRIKGNGNVGVGTNAPQVKFEVNGGIGIFDGGTRYRNAGIQTELNGSIINIGVNDSALNRFGGTYASSDQGGFLRLDTRGSENLFSFFGRPATNTAATQLVVVSSAGNMGIGTTSPGTKLDVNGGIRAAGGTSAGYTFSGGGDTDGGLFSPSDGIVTIRTNASERVRVDFNGNLGIGATSLSQKLTVAGDSLTTGTAYLLDTNHSIKAISGGGVAISTFGVTNGLYLQQTSGSVGIGTTSPATTLDVRGATPIITIGTTTGTNGGIYLGNSGHGLLRSYPSNLSNNNVGLYTTAGDVYLSGNGQATNHLVVKNSGYVGIGTNSPGTPLHVAGGVKLGSFHRGARMQPDVTGDVDESNFDLSSGTANVWGGRHTSIVSDGRIKASAFDTTNLLIDSDIRIKRIAGISSGAKDLVTLLRLEITDYNFIDRVTHGGAPQKKVIAQQLESVFPQAVSRAAGVVPDIYQMAGFRDGWVELATDLKVGERVKLVGDEANGVHEVLEVKPDRFRTGFTQAGEKVFVYGREVSDFRSVDYDAIAMLNVSATQEIKREKDAEVAALRADNEALRSANEALRRQVNAQDQRLANLEAQARARDTKVAAIEKLLQSSQTVMARPAPGSNANGQE